MPAALTPEQFWARMTKGGAAECWLWTSLRNKQGYGQIHFRGRWHRAHRLAWTLTHGPIPEGLWVLHRCDNPPCCNPAHLFLGNRVDNMQDASHKGRLSTSRCAGEANGNVKLTREDVARVQQALGQGASQYDLAAAFGVTQSVISKINTGKHWVCKEQRGAL